MTLNTTTLKVRRLCDVDITVTHRFVPGDTFIDAFGHKRIILEVFNADRPLYLFDGVASSDNVSVPVTLWDRICGDTICGDISWRIVSGPSYTPPVTITEIIHDFSTWWPFEKDTVVVWADSYITFSGKWNRSDFNTKTLRRHSGPNQLVRLSNGHIACGENLNIGQTVPDHGKA